MADDHLFLLPVVIDDTNEAQARVPEKFLTVQWLRLPEGKPDCRARGVVSPDGIRRQSSSRSLLSHPQSESKTLPRLPPGVYACLFHARNRGQRLRHWVRSAWLVIAFGVDLLSAPTPMATDHSLPLGAVRAPLDVPRASCKLRKTRAPMQKRSRPSPISYAAQQGSRRPCEARSSNRPPVFGRVIGPRRIQTGARHPFRRNRPATRQRKSSRTPLSHRRTGGLRCRATDRSASTQIQPDREIRMPRFGARGTIMPPMWCMARSAAQPSGSRRCSSP
jgi:hypothetical protein